MGRKQIVFIGLLLIIIPVIIMASWLGLIYLYDYPDILRKPVQEILVNYQNGGTVLKLCWLGLMIGSFLIVPLALSLHRFLNNNGQIFVLIGTGFGVMTAFFHFIGFSRWIFVVDFLAGEYANPSTSLAKHEAIEMVFKAMHLFFGVTLGETMGFITMGMWAIFLSLSLFKKGIINGWFLIISIASGIGIMTGVFEWVGWKAAPEINAIAYQLWIVLLMMLGVRFIIRWRQLEKK